MSRNIKIKSHDGGSFDAYVAMPPSGSGPAIVVLQEIFGVNKTMRDVADYYAEEGYVAIAPDLFMFGPRIELGYGPDDFKRPLTTTNASTSTHRH